MGKTCPTGAETDPVHQRKPPKRPALPSQIFILADAAAMALAGESSLGKPAHWHGPSPKTYAIQSNTQESSSDTRSRCAKGPLDPIVGGRDLGR